MSTSGNVDTAEATDAINPAIGAGTPESAPHELPIAGDDELDIDAAGGAADDDDDIDDEDDDDTLIDARV